MPAPRIFRIVAFGLLSVFVFIAGCREDQPDSDVSETPVPEAETESELGYDVASSPLVPDYETVDLLA